MIVEVVNISSVVDVTIVDVVSDVVKVVWTVVSVGVVVVTVVVDSSVVVGPRVDVTIVDVVSDVVKVVWTVVSVDNVVVTVVVESPICCVSSIRVPGFEDKLKETFLVCNGDIITDLDIYKFIEFHKEKGGIATVATTKCKTKISLGVIRCNGDSEIISFTEKPEMEYLVSMGIYLFEPEIFNYISKGTPFGFDDLMKTLLFKNIPVYSYIDGGYWFDIGRQEDFRRAQDEFMKNPEKILGD